MSWAVVATFAGIGVTAVLGAITAAHEQTPMKQLERVTALLKDTPTDASERAQLVWLRDELSRRVNERYRAPRDRFGLGLGWLTGLYGAGLTVVFLPALIHLLTKDWTPTGEFPVEVQPLIYGGLLVLGIGLIVIGRYSLKTRREARRRWIDEHTSTESAQPRL